MMASYRSKEVGCIIWENQENGKKHILALGMYISVNIYDLASIYFFTFMKEFSYCTENKVLLRS